MALNQGIWDPRLRGTNIKGTNLKSLNPSIISIEPAGSIAKQWTRKERAVFPRLAGFVLRFCVAG